ncbi:hypothetical protein BL107_08199 [Synechococcus sp. BL107]|nr:hypothetical protein BL107_08199 [Synechococcus sp. BL107]
MKNQFEFHSSFEILIFNIKPAQHVMHRLMRQMSCPLYLGLPILNKVVIQKDAIGLQSFAGKKP